MGLTPLWLDEVQQLGNAWRPPLREFIQWTETSPGAVPLPALLQQLTLRLFGYSTFVARLPAACFGILAALAFAVLCARAGVRHRFLALALFLFVPLQFRYALEARGYSQGLFFSVAALWLFLKLSERPSARTGFAYFLAIALGLYSQPFTLFPVAGQVLSLFSSRTAAAARLYAVSAMVLACLCYVPWRLVQNRALRTVVGEHDVFSFAQVRPLVLLHDLTGGGYVCAVCILALAIAGALYDSSGLPRRVLMFTAAVSLAAPVATDAAFSYFFANRQWLFAMPALILLAAGGAGVVWTKRPALLAALLAAFFVAAFLTDWRDATVPKDDLARTADALASSLSPGSCVISAPPFEMAHYSFFHAELNARICREPLNAPEVVALSDAWSTAADRQNLLALLRRDYVRQGATAIGHVDLSRYRRR